MFAKPYIKKSLYFIWYENIYIYLCSEFGSGFAYLFELLNIKKRKAKQQNAIWLE